MSPRTYRLGVRATAVSETRARVIAAARALFVEGSFYGASVDEIARRADVARATIYHQFKSKLGVLEAVISDFEERAGLGALLAVVESAPVAGLVRTVIEQGCAYWATDPTLVRKVIAVGSMQPEVQEIVDRHDAGRLEVLRRVLHRLREAGAPGDDRSFEHALSVLWIATSFDAYDLLTRGRKLEQAEASDALARLAESQLSLGG